ncbi:unnamed protein product, partial [Rhizoctonia solani]
LAVNARLIVRRPVVVAPRKRQRTHKKQTQREEGPVTTLVNVPIEIFTETSLDWIAFITHRLDLALTIQSTPSKFVNAPVFEAYMAKCDEEHGGFATLSFKL